MELCELIEIDGKPGFQECRKCGRPRFWPEGQRRPKPMPASYRRECPGRPVADPPPPREAKPKVAPEAPQPMPSARQRARNFKNARARQKAAGNPIRTADEKAKLYARCERCPSGKFVADPLLPIIQGGGQCAACGCGLSPTRKLLNAAAFGTYKCKLGHWDDLIASGAVSYVEVPEKSKRHPDPDDGRAG